MINKQKMWFLTLFSLILILSIYYITMPSELLTNVSKTTNEEKKETTSTNVSVNESDILTALQVEKDEERTALAAEYNEVLTNEKSTTEEKNNAYNSLKSMNEVKAKEEELQKKIKSNLELDSFIKIDNNKVSVVINKKEHDYTIANKVMRLIQEEYNNKMYVSVKFQG